MKEGHSETLTLFGEIGLNMAQQLIVAIRKMKQKGVVEAVLEINSTGGSLASALNIYDNLVDSGIRWKGMVIGECLSSALIVLQACNIRSALPNASFLAHESRRRFVVEELITSRPLQFYINQLTDAYNNCLEIENRGNQILCSRLKTDRTLLDEYFGKNLHFSSARALEMGLIDEIVGKA